MGRASSKDNQNVAREFIKVKCEHSINFCAQLMLGLTQQLLSFGKTEKFADAARNDHRRFGLAANHLIKGRLDNL